MDTDAANKAPARYDYWGSWKNGFADPRQPSASQPQAPPPRAVVSFERADKIEPKPTQWLIEDWLVRDTLVGLVGQTGTCKSFLAIDWACRVATGMPWLSSRVEQGQVFMLAGEGRSGLRKRIQAWETYTGTTIADAPLYIADNLPGMVDIGNTTAIIQAITDVADAGFFETGNDPSLIIVDTVARGMAGANENDAGDMGRFISALDWIRTTWSCTVLAVHHTGHGESDRARGSSAFRAALDAEFMVKAEGNSITVRSTKSKDWRAADPVCLKRVEIEVERGVERPETSLILTESINSGTERERKAKVYRLRDEGKSYTEITGITGIPKTTAYRWCNP